MPLLAILASGTVRAGVNEWTNVGPAGGSIQCLIVDSQDPNTVYAGTRVGVFKSTDGGESWTPISGSPDRIRLLTDPNTVYAGGPDGLFAISLDPLVQVRP